MIPRPTTLAGTCGRTREPGQAWRGMRPSLSALGHPLTLACIGLLLVNDHFLKRLYPSTLTGKLSDFAGLFFFPFLLTALLGLAGFALSRLLTPSPRLASAARITPRIPAISAYLLTAVLFSAIKVHPPLNVAVNGLLRLASGLPLWIALDPTDLTTLVALAPSFALLTSLDSLRTPPPMRRSLLALGLASLAALATAPCPPEQPITHLVSTDRGLYALATAWEPVSNAFLSTSDGQAWDYQDPETLPSDILVSAAVPVQLPKIVCVPAQDQVCYRVAGEEKVEASTDGGRTWQVAWSVPASRRAYMERVASGYGMLLVCGKDLDLRANDVVVIRQGEDHVAIVALGNEGVLRGRYDLAEWSRVGVGWAEPSLENGGLSELFPPMIIYAETAWALIAGAAALIFLSIVAWGRLNPGGDPLPQETRGRLPWVVGVVVDLTLLGLMALGNVEELIPMVAPPLFILTVVILFLYTGWSKAFRRSGQLAQARRSLRISAYAGLIVAVVAWLPFALWVLGTIPGYSAALILAIIAVVATMTWAMGRLPKPSRPSPQAA